MRAAEGLICDVERGQKDFFAGVLGECEGLAFKKRTEKITEKLVSDPEVDRLNTTHSETVKVI